MAKTTSKPTAGVYFCPVTKQSVYIGKATLKDLKAASTYSNGGSKRRLWTLPSASVRTDLLVEAAQALAHVEQSLLPSFGGRSWQVTCQLSDSGALTLFRAYKGKMELAVLPHLIEKIPVPPRWPGRSLVEEYQEGHQEESITNLQEREISSLSQVAWELRHGRKHEVPSVTLKWATPEGKLFYSRKSAWEHATQMAAREQEIDKHLVGMGMGRKLLQPFVPSAKKALEVGTLRFERDGLWVIGQELSWQDDRPLVLQESLGIQEEERLRREPTSSLELFFHKKRPEYIESHMDCQTVAQAESELRKVWKKLSKEEKQEFMEPFQPKKEEKEVDPEKEMKPKKPRKKKEPKEPKPEPVKLSIAPRDYFVQERRQAFIEERRIKRPGWGDLKPSEVDVHLRQEWKDLDAAGKKEWTDKVLAIEMKKLEVERQKREAEEAIIRAKEEAERKEREAKEEAERKERAAKEEAERKEREAKEAAAKVEKERMECEQQEAAAKLAKELEEEKKEDDANAKPAHVASSSNAKADDEPEETMCPIKKLVNILKNRRAVKARQINSKKIQFPTEKSLRRWCMNQEQIDKCFAACMDHHDTVMRTVKARDLHQELQDGFDVFRERGFGRYDMELPAFDDPNEFDFLTDLNKAPWMPGVKAILGDDALLIHKGCFLSMPGAAPQVYHQDGVHLSTQSQKPCHAVNVFIPLVDLTSRNGPTEFCLGSHVLGLEDYDKDFVEIPTPTAGTPVIFDYRLGHRGLGNSSQSVRPIVYVTYARATQGKEFRDSVNFSRKRYHKIGELKCKSMTREERKNRRKRSIESQEIEDLQRAMENSTSANSATEDKMSDESSNAAGNIPSNAQKATSEGDNNQGDTQEAKKPRLNDVANATSEAGDGSQGDTQEAIKPRLNVVAVVTALETHIPTKASALETHIPTETSA